MHPLHHTYPFHHACPLLHHACPPSPHMSTLTMYAPLPMHYPLCHACPLHHALLHHTHIHPPLRHARHPSVDRRFSSGNEGSVNVQYPQKLEMDPNIISNKINKPTEKIRIASHHQLPGTAVLLDFRSCKSRILKLFCRYILTNRNGKYG